MPQLYTKFIHKCKGNVDNFCKYRFTTLKHKDYFDK